jgi:phosphoribosyl-dephospho-CoA transferase
MMYARHNLVWLSGLGWQHVLDDISPCHRLHVADWKAADWPAVARRADPHAELGDVCLGIALPPHPESGVKTRIPLRAKASGVKKVVPPLSLDAASAALPAAWQSRIQPFAADAAANDLAFKVFGSLALEALTGRRYLTASSDIDLLFHPASRNELERGLALLDAHAAALPLDGEIVFPSGEAVAWKEWRNAARPPHGQRVLVKGRTTVRLATTEALLSTLKEN